MRLFRPIGLEELVLLFRSGMRRFPPRLPAQPIFYPVLNAAYATQIARDWNAPTGSMAGFVTAFEVAESYARGFEVHRVGSREALELWVPAEELETFNDHLEGPPTRIARVRGAISSRTWRSSTSRTAIAPCAPK